VLKTQQHPRFPGLKLPRRPVFLWVYFVRVEMSRFILSRSTNEEISCDLARSSGSQFFQPRPRRSYCTAKPWRSDWDASDSKPPSQCIMNELAKPLSGIIPPLVTPLEHHDTLDQPGLDRLVEHVLAGGVSGIFLLGTSGEGPSLSYRLRGDLVRQVCRQVAGRVPVLVGVTDTSLVESLRMAAVAAEAGAAVSVLAPPPYFPVRQADLRRYAERFAEESPLPLLLYNMPSHTKLAYEIDTLRHLMDVPGIVGLKDSSGDLTYFRSVAEISVDRPDFSLFMGPEQLLAEAIRLGASGGVCGGANLDPQLYVDLCAAMRSGNLDAANRLRERVSHIAREVYRHDQGSLGVIKGLKCALGLMGICSDAVAPPLQTLNESQRENIRSALERIGLLAGQSRLPHRATSRQDEFQPLPTE
jgi:dihydrodipicolinate synthase/N-acetylneuraminate lyase